MKNLHHRLTLLLFILLNSILLYKYYNANYFQMLRAVKPGESQSDKAFFLLYIVSIAAVLGIMCYAGSFLLRSPLAIRRFAGIFYTSVWYIAIADTEAFLRTGIHLLDSYVLRGLLSPDFYRNIRFTLPQLALIAGLPVVLRLAQKGLHYLAHRFPGLFRFPRRAMVGIGIFAILFGAGSARAFYVIKNDRFRMAGNPILKALPGYFLFFSDWAAVRLKVAYTIPAVTIEPEKRASILMVVADSVYSETVNRTTMPLLFQRRQQKPGIKTLYHFSTAHYTEPGIFSLISGLDGFHYQPFSSANTKLAPLQILRQNGYSLHAFASSQLRTWHNAEFMFDQFDEYREFIAHESYEKDDGDMVAAIEEFSKSKQEPFFMIAVLNSTHHNYPYPPEFEKFKPALAQDYDIQDIRNSGNWNGLRNRHLNSLLYVDFLLDKILNSFSEMIDKGQLIVVFTSDHGEEFNERGQWGHILPNPFNEQMRSPLYFYFPGSEKAPFHKVSCSSDIFPTIFDSFSIPAERLPLNGQSLLRKDDPGRLITVMGLGFPYHGSLVTAISGGMKVRLEKNKDLSGFSRSLITDLDDRTIDPPEEEVRHIESLLLERLFRYIKKED